MGLPENISSSYKTILQNELLVAMGCTEPIAIAYASAVLCDMLGGMPSAVNISLSGNIIKNVKSVVVPATGNMHGIKAAVAAGAVANAPYKKLAILTALTDADIPKIKEYCDNLELIARESEAGCAFDIDISAKMNGKSARVRIKENHTGITVAELDGKDLKDRYISGEISQGSRDICYSLLNVEDIVSFANETDLEGIKDLLERQIELNLAIAEEGLNGDYGASIGKLLYKDGNVSAKEKAKAYAAAGSDARMSGCTLPVAIISGSGNQGITASLPVLCYAKELGADDDKLLRALVVSDLITIHQKTGIGCLSAYCGAISAGCGSACGICYLHGGGFYEIAHTLVNAVAILSGTICDGAKPSCAAKIAMAVEAGIMGYEMQKMGKQFYGGDGIVTKGVENTIKNIGRLARDGMSSTDKEIIKIMLEERRS